MAEISNSYSLATAHILSNLPIFAAFSITFNPVRNAPVEINAVAGTSVDNKAVVAIRVAHKLDRRSAGGGQSDKEFLTLPDGTSIIVFAVQDQSWGVYLLYLIKIADKTCNLRSILTDPPKDWPVTRQLEYFEWASQVVARLKGDNATLDREVDAIIETGSQQLADAE